MVAIKVVALVTFALEIPLGLSTANAFLPVVDLDYALHRATVNETGQYYNFSNIRYAAPPTGDLRFAAPVSPTEVNRTINDGQEGAICAQAAPNWYAVALNFSSGANASTLELVNAEAKAAADALTIESIGAPSPFVSEDCLFLDVIVPKSIYEFGKAAHVLVWIYGGGYTAGSKTDPANPPTLISRSQENGGEGVVFVAINYRLGLFGWLSGPTLAESGSPNAGLLDQRLALEWVQKYIHLFGGDSSRVTVIGESAGAASLMHQITAYAGQQGKVLFSQAILQSPAFSPVVASAQQEETYQSVIKQAQELIDSNINSLSALRSLDFTTLAALNSIAVARSAPYGTYTFGPVVDGMFVPKLPGLLLLEGAFDKSVKIMVGHNSDEAKFFTYPLFSTDSDVATNLKITFPTASNSTINFILETLYPPVYDGSYPYASLFERVSLITSEASFVCNTRYLNTAFGNTTHAYYFTVPPGLHAEDTAYTFFNGDTTTRDDGFPVDAAVATVLQDYITSFAMNGNPNRAGIPYFPEYQSNSTTVVLDITKLGQLQTDTAANDRCTWWQQALYA